MWDKELVDLLIIKYRQHELLYNARHPKYLDRVKRSKALLEICNQLQEVKSNVTVGDIKKKIHTLRSQYIKETRAIANDKSGESTEDVYIPKLWCFNELKFLKPHVTYRKIESHYIERDESSVDDFSMAQNTKPATHPRYQKRDEVSIEDEVTIENEVSIEDKFQLARQHKFSKKDNESASEDEILFEEIIEPAIQNRYTKSQRAVKLEEEEQNINNLLADREGEYDWLGKQVMFEMKSIKNKKIQRDTAWKIQTVLRKASLEDEAICEYILEHPISSASH